MDLSVTVETIGADDQRWLGSAHGTSSGDPVVIDASYFTANTHYPNGFLPSGTCLAKHATSGRYGPYTTGDTNLGTAAGFLLTPTQVKSGTATPSGALMWHGEVVAANLPFTSGAGSIDSTGKGQLPLVKFV